MSQQTPARQAGRERPAYWNDAARYASMAGDDKPFVDEVAYMMVTLHRTGV